MKTVPHWCALALGFAARLACAQPVYSPATGSWYEAILTQNTWTAANSEAAATSFRGIPGHLATITTPAENDFLVDSVLPVHFYGFWIGGKQAGDIEPADGWEWIKGEPWTFTNWDIGEPNNADLDEDFLQIYSNWNDAPVPDRRLPGSWNDIPDGRITHSAGYVIEYTPVPEPAPVILLAGGAFMLLSARRSDLIRSLVLLA